MQPHRRARIATPLTVGRALVLGLAIGFATPVAPADYLDDIGWNELQARLGPEMPSGAGIIVLQVEASDAGGWLPFSGTGTGDFTGKMNVDLTGGGTLSGHAETVGHRWYGNSAGVAPGVTLIYSHFADYYLNNVLDWYETKGPDFADELDPGDVRIVNNSWVALTTGTNAKRAIRRADFQTDVYGLIYCNGVRNSRTEPVPPVMASSHNGIAVGLFSGNSSTGPTTFDGTRAKPDISAPDTATSWATGQVSGAVALLLEQSATLDPEAQRPMTIKAVLMAGARKQFNWEKGADGPEDDPVYPLDVNYGAGRLRVDRNYDIMAAGRTYPNTAALLPRRGWSHDVMEGTETLEYLLHLPTTSTEISVALVWHRHHSGNFNTDGLYFLNNIYLELWSTDENHAATTLVQESRSDNDNIQHIYATALTPGIYLVRLRKMTDIFPGPEEIGLAWWSNGGVITGDMNGDGTVNNADISAFILAITQPSNFQETYPGVDPDLWGDVTGDGTLNNADIPGFVALLTGGG